VQARAEGDGGGVHLPRNEVLLVGRVSTAAEERQLPSGDLLVTFRVVVERPPPRRPAPEGVRVPTFDALTCVGWSARVRRTASTLVVGDVVEVTGAVRQRYWRGGAGLGSRTEVEALTLRRLVRAAGG
jgi:single-strand DNA-binding protein